MTDDELLVLEVATLWSLDPAGDLLPADSGPGHAPPLVVVGSTAELVRVWFSPEVPSPRRRELAILAETARSKQTSVEAGVWTYEPYRRQGHARAAVASWTALVPDKRVFYRTSWDNAGSQAVARSLDFRQFAQIWRISPD